MAGAALCRPSFAISCISAVAFFVSSFVTRSVIVDDRCSRSCTAPSLFALPPFTLNSFKAGLSVVFKEIQIGLLPSLIEPRQLRCSANALWN